MCCRAYIWVAIKWKTQNLTQPWHFTSRPVCLTLWHSVSGKTSVTLPGYPASFLCIWAFNSDAAFDAPRLGTCFLLLKPNLIRSYSIFFNSRNKWADIAQPVLCLFFYILTRKPLTIFTSQSLENCPFVTEWFIGTAPVTIFFFF